MAGVAGQGDKEAVDAHHVRQALAVGDRQRLVGAVARLAGVYTLLGGHHRGTQRAEHVVVGRRALPMAGVRPEADEQTSLGEFAQAMLGAIVRVEEHMGELVGGEHAVLADQVQDGVVAVGEPAGEGGELVGHAPPPARSTSAGAGASLLACVGGGHCERPPVASRRRFQGR